MKTTKDKVLKSDGLKRPMGVPAKSTSSSTTTQAGQVMTQEPRAGQVLPINLPYRTTKTMLGQAILLRTPIVKSQATKPSYGPTTTTESTVSECTESIKELYHYLCGVGWPLQGDIEDTFVREVRLWYFAGQGPTSSPHYKEWLKLLIVTCALKAKHNESKFIFALTPLDKTTIEAACVENITNTIEQQLINNPAIEGVSVTTAYLSKHMVGGDMVPVEIILQSDVAAKVVFQYSRLLSQTRESLSMSSALLVNRMGHLESTAGAALANVEMENHLKLMKRGDATFRELRDSMSRIILYVQRACVDTNPIYIVTHMKRHMIQLHNVVKLAAKKEFGEVTDDQVNMQILSVYQENIGKILYEDGKASVKGEWYVQGRLVEQQQILAVAQVLELINIGGWDGPPPDVSTGALAISVTQEVVEGIKRHFDSVLHDGGPGIQEKLRMIQNLEEILPAMFEYERAGKARDKDKEKEVNPRDVRSNEDTTHASGGTSCDVSEAATKATEERGTVSSSSRSDSTVNMLSCVMDNVTTNTTAYFSRDNTPLIMTETQPEDMRIIFANAISRLEQTMGKNNDRLKTEMEEQQKTREGELRFEFTSRLAIAERTAQIKEEEARVAEISRNLDKGCQSILGGGPRMPSPNGPHGGGGKWDPPVPPRAPPNEPSSNGGTQGQPIRGEPIKQDSWQSNVWDTPDTTYTPSGRHNAWETNDPNTPLSRLTVGGIEVGSQLWECNLTDPQYNIRVIDAHWVLDIITLSTAVLEDQLAKAFNDQSKYNMLTAGGGTISSLIKIMDSPDLRTPGNKTLPGLAALRGNLPRHSIMDNSQKVLIAIATPKTTTATVPFDTTTTDGVTFINVLLKSARQDNLMSLSQMYNQVRMPDKVFKRTADISSFNSQIREGGSNKLQYALHATAPRDDATGFELGIRFLAITVWWCYKFPGAHMEVYKQLAMERLEIVTTSDGKYLDLPATLNSVILHGGECENTTEGEMVKRFKMMLGDQMDKEQSDHLFSQLAKRVERAKREYPHLGMVDITQAAILMYEDDKGKVLARHLKTGKPTRNTERTMGGITNSMTNSFDTMNIKEGDGYYPYVTEERCTHMYGHPEEGMCGICLKPFATSPQHVDTHNNGRSTVCKWSAMANYTSKAGVPDWPVIITATVTKETGKTIIMPFIQQQLKTGYMSELPKGQQQLMEGYVLRSIDMYIDAGYQQPQRPGQTGGYQRGNS